MQLGGHKESTPQCLNDRTCGRPSRSNSAPPIWPGLVPPPHRCHDAEIETMSSATVNRLRIITSDSAMDQMVSLGLAVFPNENSSSIVTPFEPCDHRTHHGSFSDSKTIGHRNPTAQRMSSQLWNRGHAVAVTSVSNPEGALVSRSGLRTALLTDQVCKRRY